MKRIYVYTIIISALILITSGILYFQSRRAEEAEYQRKLEARFDYIAYRIEPYFYERFNLLRNHVKAESDLMRQAYNYDKYNYTAYFKYLYDQSKIGYQLRWDPRSDIIFMSYVYRTLVGRIPKSRKEEGKAFYNLECIGCEFWELFDVWDDYDAYIEKSHHIISTIDESLYILRKYDVGQNYDKNSLNLGPSDLKLENF